MKFNKYAILLTTVFMQRAEQALPRLQVLNPNVSIKVDTESVEDKNDTYFAEFDVVCAT